MLIGQKTGGIAFSLVFAIIWARIVKGVDVVKAGLESDVISKIEIVMRPGAASEG